MTPDETNKRMAEYMGWHDRTYTDGRDWWLDDKIEMMISVSDWNPYGDIAQAFMVLEKWCKDNDGGYQLTRLLGSNVGEPHRLIISEWDGQSFGFGHFDSVEAAICAALVAWIEQKL